MSVVTDWSVYLDEPKKTAKKTVETIVQNPSRVSIFGARASGKTTMAIKTIVQCAKTTLGTHAFIS